MQSPVLATVGMSVRPSVRPSVLPSVCLSHAGTESKRRKLGSRNLQRQIAQGLYSFRDKKFIQKFDNPREGVK